MAIPKPSGPHGIGSITQALVDAGRTAHLASETPGRRLFVKAWYPTAETTAATEPLWAELRHDARTPLPIRLMLGCLRARTSTLPGAAFSPAVTGSPLVVYNHGLISFAAENTSLMEELASHGFTVLAIQHADQLAELQALNRAQTADEQRLNGEIERQLKAASGQQKAMLAPPYYQGARNTVSIVTGRSADTSFVMTNAGQLLAAIPGLGLHSVDTGTAHLVGFSVGGAVSTVTAERDPRAHSVTNLDGGMYGSRNSREIRMPYLMMYSAVNEGINDCLLPDHAQRTTPAATTHLNYHDVAALVPVLRYLRATGATDASAFAQHRNRSVLAFLLQRRDGT